MPLVILKAHCLNVEELRELIASKWLSSGIYLACCKDLWKLTSSVELLVMYIILQERMMKNMLITIDESTNPPQVTHSGHCTTDLLDPTRNPHTQCMSTLRHYQK